MTRLLVWLTAAMIRLLARTLRVTMEDAGELFHHPDHPPCIIAFWHNRLALNSYLFERYVTQRQLITFISLSRDGQFIADVAACFGVKAVRGSTSRKGSLAALQAIRAARDPRADIAISPDGPRGPRYQIQPGILRLAQATRRPIVTLTYHLEWKLELNSWDRFQVPLPFSRCRVVTQKPIPVPEDASDEDLGVISSMVAQALGTD